MNTKVENARNPVPPTDSLLAEVMDARIIINWKMPRTNPYVEAVRAALPPRPSGIEQPPVDPIKERITFTERHTGLGYWDRVRFLLNEASKAAAVGDVPLCEFCVNSTYGYFTSRVRGTTPPDLAGPVENKILVEAWTKGIEVGLAAAEDHARMGDVDSTENFITRVRGYAFILRTTLTDEEEERIAEMSKAAVHNGVERSIGLAEVAALEGNAQKCDTHILRAIDYSFRSGRELTDGDKMRLREAFLTSRENQIEVYIKRVEDIARRGYPAEASFEFQIKIARLYVQEGLVEVTPEQHQRIAKAWQDYLDSDESKRYGRVNFQPAAKADC